MRAQGGLGEALWETHLAVGTRLLEDPNKTERETPLPPSDSAGTPVPRPCPSQPEKQRSPEIPAWRLWGLT